MAPNAVVSCPCGGGQVVVTAGRGQCGKCLTVYLLHMDAVPKPAPVKRVAA